MATVSKNWTFDLTKALNAQTAVMAQGGFKLVAIAATLYIDNLYWQVPSVSADKTTAYLHETMLQLDYGKSSKAALANAALSIARKWVKLYGAPHAAERNIFWTTISDATDFEEMMDFIISAIRHDFGDTMQAVYATLKTGVKAATTETTFAEKVKKSFDKADTDDASKAAVVAMGFLATEDRFSAIEEIIGKLDKAGLVKAFDMINDKLTMYNEEQAKVDAMQAAKAA